MIKAIIFDLWGTLAYKKESFVSKIIKLFDLPNNEVSLAKIENALMTKNFSSKEKCYKYFIEFFHQKNDDKKKWQFFNFLKQEEFFSSRVVYSDAKHILKKLRKSYKIGLISNTPQYGMSFLEKRKILKLIDVDIRSYNAGVVKPHKKIFRMCLKKLHVKPNEAVMVGDTYASDIKESLKLGMKAVLIVRKGFKRAYSKNKHRYKYTIENLNQLPYLLKKLNS